MSWWDSWNTREQEIIELKEQGLSFRKIGEKLGLSVTRANQIYRQATRRKRAAKETTEPALWDLTYDVIGSENHYIRYMRLLYINDIKTLKAFAETDINSLQTEEDPLISQDKMAELHKAAIEKYASVSADIC